MVAPRLNCQNSSQKDPVNEYRKRSSTPTFVLALPSALGRLRLRLASVLQGASADFLKKRYFSGDKMIRSQSGRKKAWEEPHHPPPPPPPELRPPPYVDDDEYECPPERRDDDEYDDRGGGGGGGARAYRVRLPER